MTLQTTSTQLDERAGSVESFLLNLAEIFHWPIMLLVVAALTFAIHTVRRRWLLQELTLWISSQSTVDVEDLS